VPSPSPGAANDVLFSVSCVSASSCVAVGITYNNAAYETLVFSWDGSAWTRVPSPNAGNSNDQLNGVDCVTANSCIAVGSWLDGAVVKTLVESLTGSQPAPQPPSPSPSPSVDPNTPVPPAFAG
jgi:hypothetical protein